MYGDVWTWAGEQRTVETKIGVDYPRIGVELREVFDDALYWLKHTTFPPVEFALRLHHRLVFVHPFAQRQLSTDAFLRRPHPHASLQVETLDGVVGSSAMRTPRRTEYIEALRAAHKHDNGRLVQFATY